MDHEFYNNNKSGSVAVVNRALQFVLFESFNFTIRQYVLYTRS